MQLFFTLVWFGLVKVSSFHRYHDLLAREVMKRDIFKALMGTLYMLSTETVRTNMIDLEKWVASWIASRKLANYYINPSMGKKKMGKKKEVLCDGSGMEKCWQCSGKITNQLPFWHPYMMLTGLLLSREMVNWPTDGERLMSNSQSPSKITTCIWMGLIAQTKFLERAQRQPYETAWDGRKLCFSTWLI